MATLKPILKGYKRSDGKCKIYIRIIHKSKLGYVPTTLYCEPKAMRSDGSILPSYPHRSKLQRQINSLLFEYENILLDMDTRKLTVAEIVKRLANKDNGSDFIRYAKLRIEQLRKESRESYAITYDVMLTHLVRFTNRLTLNFTEINVTLLVNFESYLRVRGCKVNTIRIYLNNIRAVFNHALDNDIIQLPSPFRKFKVRQESSEKRSISVNALRKLRIGPYLPVQQRAVDLFFLSFYLLGINLKDLLYLEPDAIHDGRIHYRRAKTKVLFSVKILPEAENLLKKYEGKKYLLRFIDEDDSFFHYKSILKETNKRLRLAAGYKLSYYSARHSWATLASDLEIPKETISLALGHSLGSRMTDVYIRQDLKKVDEANERVLAHLSL